MAGVEGTGNYIGNTKDMLVETTQRLRHHPTFVITGPKVSFDVVDIGNDVILIDQIGSFVIVVGKYETYFTTVIPDGSWGIVFGIKEL